MRCCHVTKLRAQCRVFEGSKTLLCKDGFWQVRGWGPAEGCMLNARMQMYSSQAMRGSWTLACRLVEIMDMCLLFGFSVVESASTVSICFSYFYFYGFIVWYFSMCFCPGSCRYGFLPSSGSVAVFAVFSSDTQDSRLFTRQTGIGPFGSMPKLQANAHWRAQRSRQALRHRFSWVSLWEMRFFLETWLQKNWCC